MTDVLYQFRRSGVPVNILISTTYFYIGFSSVIRKSSMLLLKKARFVSSLEMMEKLPPLCLLLCYFQVKLHMFVNIQLLVVLVYRMQVSFSNGTVFGMYDHQFSGKIMTNAFASRYCLFCIRLKA